MGTVTKRTLAVSVAEATGCRKGEAALMVDKLFEGMREILSQGNRIEIRGFGVFRVMDVKAKPEARNPRTGEAVHVPRRRKTHFRPGKDLKEALHQPT